MLYPPQINYERPESLSEALSLLNDHPWSLIMAGGTISVLSLKKRAVNAELVVDIGRLHELKGIDFRDGRYRIGSAVKIYEIAESGFEGPGFSLLRQAASSVGDPLLRNMGTVGGNVCLGDPSNDLPPALLVLGAELNVVNHAGARNLNISDFYKGPFRTSLAKNEILDSINFSEPGKGYRWFYYKHYIRHLDHSVVNVAALGKVIGGRIADLRIAVGGMSVRVPTPIETSWAVGKHASHEELSRIVKSASEKCLCTDDRQGSAEYKKRMIEKITQMALLSVMGDAL
ncbi:MAG: xanthine dehydrogenase family protein subunit M [Thaumarchaeota archaeon]|jgi:carbon-monoxide dehydrogenase medium subunit|nr:xanthine dehydrogenase family protein subunit M [Nitrososphaerota archaeon]MDG6927431.1 xanthine dehydrogenase family protein subunit M [Nitrososphaerota archaeon]MDG6931898.1 xanthine dehydrogenase family protein subunit M [Nitrososphaerota archaeon]